MFTSITRLCRVFHLGLCLSLLATGMSVNAQEAAPSDPGRLPSGLPGPVFSDAQKEAQRKAATDLLSSVQADLAAGKKSLVIPPGDYRFDRDQDVLWSNLSDVTIEATGATFWIAPNRGSDRGVTLDGCRNVQLRGLTIDSDPLPWTQGVIEEIDAKAETMVIRIDEGYKVLEGKELTNPGRILFFDGQTRLELPVMDDQATKFEALGGRRLKINKFNTARVFRNAVPGRPVQTGDLFAFFTHFGGGSNLHLNNCESVRIENVTIHGACSFAFWESKGKGGNHYIGCKLTRRPGSNRLMASSADCFHSFFMEKGPLVENCEFSHSGDDLIAIHGFFGAVLRVISPREIIVVSPFGKILDAGSALLFSDTLGASIPRGATVKSVEQILDPAVLAEAKALPATFRQEQKLSIRNIDDNYVVRVVLDQDIPLQKYALVSCPDYSGRGAVVRNNHLHDGHIRGILVKSHDILIENNRIERTANGGIVLEPEFYWLEGPFCKNIRIINNTLVQNGWSSFDSKGFGISHAAIQLGSHFGRSMFPRTLVSGLHIEDIQITGNQIERPAGYAIMVMNTQGATVTDNKITRPFAAGEMPNYYDFSRQPDAAATLTPAQREELKAPRSALFVYASQEITLEGNTVEQPPAFLPTTADQ